MKRLLLLLFALLFTLSSVAQKPRKRTTRRARTTQVTKQKKQTTQKKQKTTYTKEQLRQQQQAAAKARQKEQARAAQLNRDIKATLDSVLILDNQIKRQQASIDTLSRDIRRLKVRINSLQTQLDSLQQQLAEKKQRYAKAMVYMQRNRNVQKKLMFIFSAKNLEQLLRRMRYVREYSTYQRAQGQIIKEKQAEVHRKQNELLEAKTKLETHRMAIEEKRNLLRTAKQSSQKQVAYLNRNLANVQQQIKNYQKKEASLNAQIDKMIQEEIAAERRRKEEERRRREEKAAAERKRLAEAKAARERAEAAKAAAEAAANKAQSDEERKTAKANMKTAASTLKTAKSEEKAAEKALTKALKKDDTASADDAKWNAADAADRKLSSDFASNRGRLPVPITGPYSIIGHYGRYSVEGLSHVTLDNKGIDLRGQSGAQARAVFQGTVSQVFQFAGRYIVMIRHGRYISVYSGLSSVSVQKGQNVSTSQSLGAVGTDDNGRLVLHFQLRQESQRLNPEQWLR